MIEQKSLEKLAERLSTLDRIIITTHMNPDPDGIGAELALDFILKRLGKQNVILNADPVPERLEFLDPFKKIKNLTESPGFTLPWEGDSFLLILDNSDPERIGSVSKYLNKEQTNWIVVDHHDHATPDYFQKFQFPQKGSTSEILFDLLDHLDLSAKDDVAYGLYTGICADTGHFRFRKTSARSHEIAAILLETGIKPEFVTEKLEFQAPLARLKLRKILYSTLQIHESNKIAWIVVRMEELDRLGLTTDHLEGFANELIEPSEIQAGVLFSERSEKKTKVSLRSKGDVDLVPIVEPYGGGGHKNACGATLPLSLEKSVEMFVPELFGYLEKNYPEG